MHRRILVAKVLIQSSTQSVIRNGPLNWQKQFALISIYVSTSVVVGFDIRLVADLSAGWFPE